MNNKRTFLIIDDDQEDCEFFCEAVAELDVYAECHVAKNFEEALSALRKESAVLPNYIFLDLNMPRMNGRECLMELKKDQKLKEIPVIIYSTSSSQKDKEETREMGAVHFLTKPSEFNTLRREILYVMDKSWNDPL